MNKSGLALPVLILLGLPPTVANGTNRIAIIIQSLFGTLGYKSKGISSFPFNIYLGISSSIGALIGAYIAIDFNELNLSNLKKDFDNIQESYVNLIPTSQGGTHVNAFRNAVIDSIRNYCTEKKLIRELVSRASIT